MNLKPNLLNATFTETLAFIQGKVADGILTSDEATEFIEKLQSHMKFRSQKKKIVVKGATEEDLADIQIYLVACLSDGEDDREPSRLSLEMDRSKEEGELETSNICSKIEQALKSLDTKYFKGQIGLRLGLQKIGEFSLKQRTRKRSGEVGRKKFHPDFCYCPSLPILVFTHCVILILFCLLYCLKSRSWAQFSRLQNFSKFLVISMGHRVKT